MTLTVFEVGPTYQTSGGATPAEPFYFQTAFDPAAVTWRGVPYPGDAYPMGPSVAAGVTALTLAINANPGPFVLIGTSQGAMVTSQVYEALRAGVLAARRPDLVGGLAIGNPCRQAGCILPGGVDPGGHGIAAKDLLINPQPFWWEIAAPGDSICACPDGNIGDILSAGFYFLMANTPSFWAMIKLIWAPNGYQIMQAVMALVYTLTLGHSYINFQPLSDGRTTLQVGTDYINSIASTP